MSVSDLPALNATLNGLSTVLLTAGFICIKTGRKDAHRNCMMAAFATRAISAAVSPASAYIAAGLA